MTREAQHGRDPGAPAPVVNHEKRLVGIVSIGDLAKEEARDTGQALGEIARPIERHSQ